MLRRHRPRARVDALLRALLRVLGRPRLRLLLGCAHHGRINRLHLRTQSFAAPQEELLAAQAEVRRRRRARAQRILARGRLRPRLLLGCAHHGRIDRFHLRTQSFAAPQEELLAAQAEVRRRRRARAQRILALPAQAKGLLLRRLRYLLVL